MKTSTQSGFTLIETLIVLIIIALLAFIAVPNILRTHRAVREDSIKVDLRAFREANEAYRMKQEPPAYALSIQELVKPASGPSLLNSKWETGTLHEYRLTYSGGGKDYPDTYSLMAVPISDVPVTKEVYCIDQKGFVMGSSQGQNIPTGSAEGCVGGAPFSS